jgi:multiple sugar transport system permease protein
MTGTRLTSRAMVNTLLAVATLYMLFPLLWLATAATKGATDLYSTSMFDIDIGNLGTNLGNLVAESDGIFLRWFVNSLVYAGCGSALGALICVAAGYAFDKYRFRGKEKLFALVLGGVLIPTTALSLPLYLLASNLGVINTFWSVFVPFLTFPFGVYLARIFSQAYVPHEVIEATRVDGAGDIRAFWSVGLPMMTPGFVTIFLFQFVAIWNNFFLPLVMLSDNSLFPVSLGLYLWNGQSQVLPEFYPLVITGSFVSVVPLIIAFVLLQRFWRSGLNAGSLK